MPPLQLGTSQRVPQHTGSAPYPSELQPMSHVGGVAGQGACRADDMAATKAPAAPLAHSLAETAAVSAAAVSPPAV
jgi:hypothetical protein